MKFAVLCDMATCSLVESHRLECILLPLFCSLKWKEGNLLTSTTATNSAVLRTSRKLLKTEPVSVELSSSLGAGVTLIDTSQFASLLSVQTSACLF